MNSKKKNLSTPITRSTRRSLAAIPSSESADEEEFKIKSNSIKKRASSTDFPAKKSLKSPKVIQTKGFSFTLSFLFPISFTLFVINIILKNF